MQIADAIVLNAAGAVEPVTVNRYIDLKARTKDSADRMRLDIQYFDLVAKLRSEGKVFTAEKAKEIAKGMVNLSSDEILKKLSELYQNPTGQ